MEHQLAQQLAILGHPVLYIDDGPRVRLVVLGKGKGFVTCKGQYVVLGQGDPDTGSAKGKGKGKDKSKGKADLQEEDIGDARMARDTLSWELNMLGYETELHDDGDEYGLVVVGEVVGKGKGKGIGKGGPGSASRSSAPSKESGKGKGIGKGPASPGSTDSSSSPSMGAAY